jgi:hypothetical protein
MLYRLAKLQLADWVKADYPDTVSVETTATRVRRLRCTTGGDTVTLFRRLADAFQPPYFLLYVLHTPRTDTSAGRYQSGALDAAELRTFLAVFADFLSGDGRHDLWLSAPNDRAQVVWDRHDVFYVYGRLDRAEAILRSPGHSANRAEVPSPHAHNYHPDFDETERRLVQYYDWLKSPLQPRDEQHPPPDEAERGDP